MSVATLPAPPTQVKPIDFSLNKRPQVEYPESDGEPLGETGLHVLATLGLLDALKLFFSSHSDVYVAADMFLYYQEGKPQAHTAPDVMVIKGVSNQERRIFKIWEEGTAPCTIFEITSRSTAREDAFVKTQLYARLGVAEYFLFDPEGDYLDEQFIGYRLEDGFYVPIAPDADGSIQSEELGLVFWPEGYMIRASDPVTGERIPMLDEAVGMAKREAARAEHEAARAAAAEAEVARLKALLAQR